MITEDTIRLTNFFIGEDGKCYLVRDVRAVKMVSLVCTGDGSESDLLLGDDVCSQFEPAQASFEPFIKNRPAAPKIDKHTNRTKNKPANSVCKGKKSKYKGVRVNKTPYADGRTRYEAQHYDPATKKVKFLGCFDDELLAAAAFQEDAGNKDEAARLRALAKQPRDDTQRKADLKEQAENNPDRPLHKKKKATIWICNNKSCGIEYRTNPKKNGCISCKGNDFREVVKEVD